MSRKTVPIFGVRIDDVTYPESLAILEEAIANRQPTVVTTPNPEIVMAAVRNPDLCAAMNRARLNIPDGIGLVLASRMWSQSLREHVQGTDLVLMLAERSPAANYRWFFLGGLGNVAERAAQALSQQYPGLQIAGAGPGSPKPEDDEQTRALLRAAGRIDVLLVAYGAPKQELWLDRNLAALNIPVGIGVGGVFNYLSGDTPRAPRWIRQLRFEWLHRLITQPARWRRQLALPHFAALVVIEAARRRLQQ